LATNIIKHSYLTTGFYKGVKGFANLINPEILKDIDYNDFRKETIRNFKENTVYLTVEDIDFMTDQLIRNNPNKFTKKFDAEMFGLNKDKALPNEVKTDKNAAKVAERLKDIYWTKTINQETIEVNPKYISIYDKTKRRTEIFELIEPFTWVKTSSLGKPNRLIEITPNKKPTGSILKNNNPVQEKVENSPKEVFKEAEEPLNEPAKANKSNSLFGDVFEPTDEDMNNINSKKIIKENNNPSNYTNYSGGAQGGDTIWENIGKEFGISKQVNYRPQDLERLNKEQLEEVENAYQQAVKDLGRQPLAANTFTGGLVRRDYLQAKAADAIFAISTIVEPGEKDAKGYINKTKNSIVSGGTGYAVQMAINLGKPVYVFDQNTNMWFEYQYNQKEETGFITTSIPVLTSKFAGIGTREINEKGKQAIRDVYEKTFNNNLYQKEEGTDQNEDC